jgi:methylmalonyl-CoA/ethylmalonyl-CoA epimerase
LSSAEPQRATTTWHYNTGRPQARLALLLTLDEEPAVFTHIHHVNLLVKDLDVAIDRYHQILGVGPFDRAELDTRGVRTARFKVGDSWLVLVQPTDSDSVPGRHLAAHGEGLFLLSLGVESLAEAARDIAHRGGQFTSASPRSGLDNWQVIDLDSKQFFGAQLQCCEEG